MAGRLERVKPSAREFEPRETESVTDIAERGQQGVATLLEQRIVSDGARRYDAHHLSLDRAL